MSHLKVKQVVAWMDEWASPSSAFPKDRIGLQVGSEQDDVQGILTTLDVTREVVEEAIGLRHNMIVAHHALLYRPVGELRHDTDRGSLLTRIIRAGINVFVAHTNLDVADGGMNDVLAARLRLHKVNPLRCRNDHPAIGRVGDLPESMTLTDLATYVCGQLGLESVRYVGDGAKRITSVAVIGGSGADYVPDVVAHPADCLITGDLKYHDALDAASGPIGLIDAGHHGTEFFIADAVEGYLKTKLRAAGQSLSVRASRVRTDPFRLAVRRDD